MFVYISRQVNIFYTPLIYSLRFWLIQEVPDDQFEEDLVGRPVTHLAAAKHATGEAVYCDDIPQYAGTVNPETIKNMVGIPVPELVCVMRRQQATESSVPNFHFAFSLE